MNHTVFFDEVGPELYRGNAFRVTGLPVDATARDIRRRSEELRLKERLGVDSASGSGMLPLTPPPDVATTEQVMQRLRDPARRLEDEFFWFWPSDDGVPDDAMTALRRGDTDAAVRLWQHPEAGPAKATHVHNLAVLAHARALDADAVDPASRALWEQAYDHWRAVIADDTFWARLELRVREVADPRLTPGKASREMRRDLPAALLSINAQLAVHASRQGRHDDAVAHIGLMHRSGFAEKTVEDVLRRAVEPDTARLRALGENAEQAVDAAPGRGGEVIERFLEQAMPLLALLKSVISDDDPIAQGAGDEVATRTLRCVIPYVNETSDWAAACRVLEEILPLAATEAVRARIEENLEAARVNHTYNTCWFCKENPSKRGSVFEQKMHGNVNVQVVQQYYNSRQIQTTWQKVTIKVPRCAACKAEQQRTVRIVRAAAAVVLIAAAFTLLALGDFLIAAALLVFDAIVYFTVVGPTGSGMPRRSFRDVREFEPIRKQLSEGWAFGEKPNTG